MDDTIKNEDRCALCEVNHPHPERIQYALTHKLDDETSLRLSELFKVLGDKTRIKLLSLLVVEEEMCVCDIAEALLRHGQARGAACVIEAEQLCLLLGEDRRGDERVVTQAFTGEFETSDQLRNEFLRAMTSSTPDHRHSAPAMASVSSTVSASLNCARTAS